MNHISQGLISPLTSIELLVNADSRLKTLEVGSWLLLLNCNLEQDELPEFRMKDNLFSI